MADTMYLLQQIATPNPIPLLKYKMYNNTEMLPLLNKKKLIYPFRIGVVNQKYILQPKAKLCKLIMIQIVTDLKLMVPLIVKVLFGGIKLQKNKPFIWVLKFPKA